MPDLLRLMRPVVFQEFNRQELDVARSNGLMLNLPVDILSGYALGDQDGNTPATFSLRMDRWRLFDD